MTDTQAALRLFVETLVRWNATINLVSRKDIASIWSRHVEDSLQLVRLCGPLPERFIDLGSGGGFPGLVLSIAHQVPVDLIEEDQRKAAFLREAARITGAPATVHAVAIEAAKLPPAPLVTARALAPVGRLLDYAAPLLTPGGMCWFPKTRAVDAELAEAAQRWSMRVERFPSQTDPAGVILKLSDIRRRDLPDSPAAL